MSSDETRTALWKFWAGMAAKISGGMIGVGTTIATGNSFWGATVGTSLAHTLEHVGKEVIERRLAPRQNVRVGRAITVAYIKLREHQERGERLREDGFFEAGNDGRSAAEEVTEAALQVAMNSAQERKVDFIGAMLANVAVNPGIDLSTAHLLIELSQSLSYRSFAVLKIASNIDTFGFGGRPRQDLSGAPPELHPLMIEIFDLTRRGIIELKDKASDASTYAVLSFDEVDPVKMRLSTVGRMLYDKLELGSLDTSDPVYMQTVAQLSKLSQTEQGQTMVA